MVWPLAPSAPTRWSESLADSSTASSILSIPFVAIAVDPFYVAGKETSPTVFRYLRVCPRSVLRRPLWGARVLASVGRKLIRLSVSRNEDCQVNALWNASSHTLTVGM